MVVGIEGLTKENTRCIMGNVGSNGFDPNSSALLILADLTSDVCFPSPPI